MYCTTQGLLCHICEDLPETPPPPKHRHSEVNSMQSHEKEGVGGCRGRWMRALEASCNDRSCVSSSALQRKSRKSRLITGGAFNLGQFVILTLLLRATLESDRAPSDLESTTWHVFSSYSFPQDPGLCTSWKVWASLAIQCKLLNYLS